MPQLVTFYRFLLTHPRAVLLMGIALLSAGGFFWLQLPVGLWPDFKLPKLEVGVIVPGQDPLMVEEAYLAPLRLHLSQQPGLVDIHSWAFEGSGEIALEYMWGTNMELSYLKVLEAISLAQIGFPNRDVVPYVQQSGASQLPMIQAFIAVERGSLLEFQSLAEGVLRRRLEQLPGVGRCEVLGATIMEVWIEPDWVRLQQYRLSMASLREVIQASNYDFGVVRMGDRGRLITLSLQGQLKNLEEIRALPLRLSSDRMIRLDEIASVRALPAPASSALFDAEGSCLALNIYQRPGSDLSEVNLLVMNEFKAFKQQYPDLRITVQIDAAELVKGTLDGFRHSLLWGASLAIVIVMFFLGSWKESLVIALVVPTSLCLAGTGFALSGLGINLLTLAGLGIAIGILIDNGIIVIENISRKFVQGASSVDSVSEGASEIFIPLIASVLTTICVFIPPALLGGVNGSLLLDQTLSITWALVASLLGALLLLPVLYHQIMGIGSRNIMSPSWQHGLISRYERGLTISLLHPKWITFGTIILLFVGTWIVWNLPRQIFPSLQTRETALKISWPGDLPFIDCLGRSKALHQWLSQRSDVEQIAAWVGVIEIPGQLNKQLVNQAFFQITWDHFIDDVSPTDGWLAALQQAFPDGVFTAQMPPSQFQMVIPQAMPKLVWEIGTPGVGLPPSHKELEHLFDKIQGWDGTNSLRLPYGQEAPIQVIKISTESLARFDIPLSEVNVALADALGRQFMGRLADPNQPMSLQIGLRQDSTLLNTLERYRLPGRGISLADLVHVDQRNVPIVIYSGSEGMRQRIEWEGEGDVVQLLSLVEEVTKNRGWAVSVSGERVAGDAQQKELLWLLILGSILLYLIMAAQFESLWIPLLIILTLPLAFIGASLALWIGGGSLNVLSGLGFLMVTGIAVNDSILKVSTILQYRRSGQGISQAVEQAGIDRFRPIVLTSLTTILAVLPLLLLDGVGVELQRPIALAVIGGITVSTLISLFVLPTWFAYLAQRFSL